LFGRAAAADDADGPRSALNGAIRTYYGDERAVAYAFMIVSTISIVAGGVLVTREGSFARGLGWPVLAIGAIDLAGGIGYFVQVDARRGRALDLLGRDPVAFRREEIEQVRGTSTRYTMYRGLELGLTLLGAGVATYGLASRRDTWAGLGVGLALGALTSLTIDSFGSHHTKTYRERLSTFEPSVAADGAGVARRPSSP
jgi:hypothetical protein